MAGVQERTISVWDDKIKAHVKVAGAGPALVFLHGGWGPQWTPFHDALASDFTVYAPSHPGTGASEPESHRALDDMWDLALFYDELFDKLGLDRRSPDIRSAGWSRATSPRIFPGASESSCSSTRWASGSTSRRSATTW